MTPELEALLAKARAAPTMTPEQRDEQWMTFAYGNLACTTNHKPSRAAFAALARSKGWSRDRFVAWATDKEWW
jgi:hypothetical protein